MNSGHCSPLPSPYVPNLPIHQFAGYYPDTGSSTHAETYYPSARAQIISLDSRTNYYDPAKHIFSHPPPYYRTLDPYFNANEMNAYYYAHNDYNSSSGFDYNYNHDYQNRNASYQSVIPISANSAVENHVANSSEANRINYRHYPKNSCYPANQHPSHSSKCQDKNYTFACSNNSKELTPNKVKNSGQAVVPPTTVLPINSETASHQQVEKSPQSKVTEPSLKHVTQDGTERKGRKGKANQTKNEFLVSLPGGQPLFSVPLTKPPEKKRRGRPPKPRIENQQTSPSPENSRNTKVRYRRGSSHLQLLQTAPNFNPCVSTLQAFKHFQMKSFSNSTTQESVSQGAPTVITIDDGDSEIEVVGCFPQGTTLLTSSRQEREKSSVTNGQSDAIPCCSTSISQVRVESNVNACAKRIRSECRGTAFERKKVGNAESQSSHNAPLLNTEQRLGKSTTNLPPEKLHGSNELSSEIQSASDVNSINTNGAEKKEKLVNQTGKKTLVLDKNICLHDRIDPMKQKDTSHITKQYGETEIRTKVNKEVPDATTSSLNQKPQCLDMPNIFDLLEMAPASSNNHCTEDCTVESDSDDLSDVEGMMNSHFTSPETTGTPNQTQMQQSSSEEGASSYQTYFPSFLSDDSDSDTDSGPEQPQDTSTLKNVPNDLATSCSFKQIQDTLPEAEEHQNTELPAPSTIDSINLANENEKSSNCPNVPALNNGTIKPRSKTPATKANNAVVPILQTLPPSKSYEKLDGEGSFQFDFDTTIGGTVETSGSSTLPLYGDKVVRPIPVVTESTTVGVPRCQSGGSLKSLSVQDNIKPPSHENNTGMHLPANRPSPFVSMWKDITEYSESHPMKDAMSKEITANNGVKRKGNIINHPKLSASSESMSTFHASAFVKVLPVRKRCISESNTEESTRLENTNFRHFQSREISLPRTSQEFDKRIMTRIPNSSGNNVRHITKRFACDSPLTYLHPQSHMTQIGNLPSRNSHACSKSEEKAFVQESNKDATSKNQSDDEHPGRKIAYDQMGNRVVKRRAHRIHVPELDTKHLRASKVSSFHTYSSQESNESTTTKGQTVYRCRTHPMIKKLLKFTGTRNGKAVINETKSKLNADLNKVFVLGNNPSKRKVVGAGKLREVRLDIPGPMERRPKILDVVKGKDKIHLQRTKEAGKVTVSLKNIESQPSPNKIGTNNLSESEDEGKSEPRMQFSSSTFTPNNNDDISSQQQIREESCHVQLSEEEEDSEDDDADILNIHAERDSLIEMFN